MASLFPMIVWLTFAVVLLVMLVSAQTILDQNSSGAAVLALPSAGVPISFEQTEGYSRKLEDGRSTVEVIESAVCRDSGGRLRIRSEIRFSDNSPSSYTDLIDPVAGRRVLLLDNEKIGYRMPLPQGSEGRFAFLGIGDEKASLHKWVAKSENLGKRTFDGVELDGTRIVQAAVDDPTLINTTEQWYSDKLKLIGTVTISGPYGSYAARIRNLRRGEPDPKLFAVPSDSKIVDLRFPK